MGPTSGNDSPPASQNKSLDQQLLDDLGGTLLPGVGEPIPSKAPAAGENRDEPPSAMAKPGEGGFDAQKLRDQLGEGEDIEFGDPLTRIGRRMRAVEQLIGQQKISTTTQKMQQQIVDDLAALIQQAQQQQRKSQGKSQGGPPPRQTGAPQSDVQPGENAPEPSNRPASDSTDRLGKADAEEADLDRMRNLVKQVWGHLPQRLRDQIHSVSDEEFLPKYQELIEDYFKRLAEDDPNRP